MAKGAPTVAPPTNALAPAKAATSASERIDLLDALRGLALFGILLANVRYWAGWNFLDEQGKNALAGPAAAIVEFAHTAVIDGKFYTIFSLLFGIGFALQLSRLETRSRSATAIYVRRLVVLLVIGLTHLLFIWVGDILSLYAICGLALLVVRQWPDRALVWVAVALIALPVIGQAVAMVAGAPVTTGLRPFAADMFVSLGGAPGQRMEWLSRPDLPSFLAFAVTRWPVQIDYLVESWRIPKVLAIMMLGLWAGRRLVAGTLLSDRQFMKCVLLWGLAVGVPANLGLAALGGLEQESLWSALTAAVLYAIGVVPLGLAYAAAFVLAWPRLEAILACFGSVGRMALTNYLSHSILGIIIFFGVGFGLIGKLGPAGFYGVASLIFVGQVLFSRWWLAVFRQGPIERVWRWATYAGAEKRQIVATRPG